ncbi:RNA polymerase epsilon subunit [Macrococcus armenti]|uniref:DNA-directed RNA polymerase subunit epsilon n=1 Tax=Macrococcus armenti TaxID=2875764 RepID=A0ABY4A275_9STAP|nr:RNA polymerase epsilon subunit [Macrococcus armenti]UBH23133.1 RNA polymerase epsilon subunit [Macrococcus armenti]UOB21263.1 RNA polymerase epsilon subunit [Macrococcus armenti]
MAIFKVFYQENKAEVIIRENTQVKYFDAVSEEQVRRYLSDRPYNIEFVQKLEGAHLEYEQQADNYSVEKI